MPKRSKQPLDVRKLTGLQQWEMSSLLGISREALASFESKNRSGLPRTASLYHGLLLAEMSKPENQQAVTKESLSEAGKQKFRDQLQFTISTNRFKASQTERQVNKCIRMQEQLHQRKLLLYCAENVQASMIDMSRHLTESFISQHQQKWLADRKSDTYFAGFDDALYIRQKRLEQKYRLLIFEAEEAEKMLATLGD